MPRFSQSADGFKNLLRVTGHLHLWQDLGDSAVGGDEEGGALDAM